jgi:hypothetical protein
MQSPCLPAYRAGRAEMLTSNPFSHSAVCCRLSRQKTEGKEKAELCFSFLPHGSTTEFGALNNAVFQPRVDGNN